MINYNKHITPSGQGNCWPDLKDNFMLTDKIPENIAAKAQHLKGKANKAAINRQFREFDESHKFPICGEINVTERAIRKVRKHEQLSGNSIYGLEYALTLDNTIREIVNNYDF
jgi:hypothetical protein